MIRRDTLVDPTTKNVAYFSFEQENIPKYNLPEKISQQVDTMYMLVKEKISKLNPDENQTATEEFLIIEIPIDEKYSTKIQFYPFKMEMDFIMFNIHTGQRSYVTAFYKAEYTKYWSIESHYFESKNKDSRGDFFIENIDIDFLKPLEINLELVITALRQ